MGLLKIDGEMVDEQEVRVCFADSLKSYNYEEYISIVRREVACLPLVEVKIHSVV